MFESDWDYAEVGKKTLCVQRRPEGETASRRDGEPGEEYGDGHQTSIFGIQNSSKLSKPSNINTTHRLLSAGTLLPPLFSLSSSF